MLRKYFQFSVIDFYRSLYFPIRFFIFNPETHTVGWYKTCFENNCLSIYPLRFIPTNTESV